MTVLMRWIGTAASGLGRLWRRSGVRVGGSGLLMFAAAVVTGGGRPVAAKDLPASTLDRLQTANREELRPLLTDVARGRSSSPPAELCRALIEVRARVGSGESEGIGAALMAVEAGGAAAWRRALTDSSAELRSAALWATEFLCPRGADAESDVMNFLSDPDDRVRNAAMRALRWTDRSPASMGAATAVLTVCQAGGLGVESVWALVAGDEPVEIVIDGLRKALACQDRAIVSAAVQASACVGLKSDALRSTLMRVAANAGEAGIVRLNAIQALRVQRRGTRDATDLVSGVLHGRQLEVLRTAAISLALEQVQGAPSREELAVLATALTDESWDVNVAAADRSGRLGGSALPVLEQCLSSKSANTRCAALLAAERIGHHSLAIRPMVLQLLHEDPSEEVRVAAVRVLAELGVDLVHVCREAERLLRAGELPSRFGLLTWMGTQGAALKPLAGALATIANDPGDELSILATRALASVAGDTRLARDVLGGVSASSDTVRRCEAIAELTRLGVRPGTLSLSALCEGVGDDSAILPALRGLAAAGAEARGCLDRVETRVYADLDASVARLGARYLLRQAVWNAVIECRLVSDASGRASPDRRLESMELLRQAPSLSRRSMRMLTWMAREDPDPIIRAGADATLSVHAR